jgi:hypothetical protein
VEVDGFRELKRRIKETQARRILREISEKLLEVARETDVLSMLEEGFFALVIPETDFYGALMCIKRVKASLRNAVFSIDLKSEERLTVSCGSATYPGDGEHLVTLLRCCRERTGEDRASLARSLGLDSRSFWKAYSRLVTLVSGENPLSACHLSLSTKDADHIRNLFLDEAGRRGAQRGLLYVGSQTVDSSLFDYGGFSRLADTGMSIFTLGSRGAGSWDHPEIMPVYLEDREIREHRFLLCIADSFYYTFLGRRDGQDRWQVFHSADPYIAREMIAKLQERYLLQQRIG